MPELKPLQKYVYGKNDLDRKTVKLEKRIKKLEMETFGKKYKHFEGSD